MLVFKKKATVILASLFGCFLVIIPICFYLAGTQPVQQMLQKKISSFVPGSIEWKKISLSFNTAGFDIRGLRLLGADHSEILSIETLDAELELSKIFQRELVFLNFKIDVLKLFLKANEKGVLNIVSAISGPVETQYKKGDKKAGSSGVPFNIQIKKMSLNDARVEMAVPHKDIHLSSGRFDMFVNDVDAQKKTARLDAKIIDSAIRLPGFDQVLNLFEVKADLNGSRMTIPEFSLILGRTQLNASGTMEDIFGRLVPDFKIEASLSAEQAARILDLKTPLSGFLNANAKVNGSLDNFNCELDLFSDAATAFDLPIDIKSTGGLKNGQVYISKMQVKAKKSTALGSGTYDPKTRRLDSRVSFSSEDINDFTELAGRTSKGSLFIDGSISGTLSQPYAHLNILAQEVEIEGSELERLSGKVDVTTESGMFGGTARLETIGLKASGMRIGDLTVDTSFSKGMVKVNTLSVRNKKSAADFSGTITVLDPGTKKRLARPEFDIVLSGEQIFLTDFFKEYSGMLSASGRAKGTLGSLKGHVNLTGEEITGSQFQVQSLNIRMDGQGTIAEPYIQGRIKAEDISILEEKMAPLDLEIEMKNRNISAKGSMGFGVDGICNLDQRTFKANLLMAATDLAPYFRLAGQKELAGKVSGTLFAKGSLESLSEASLKTNFSDLVIRFREHEAIKAEKIELSVDNGFWALPETHLRLFEKGEALLKGQGQGPEIKNVQLNSKFPLAMIDTMFEQVDQAGGQIDLSAQIEGNVKKPKMSAKVQFEDLGMVLSYLDGAFKGINGTIQLEENTIAIHQLNGFLGDGEFSAHGQMALKDMALDAGSLSLEARRLPLDFPDMMELKVNSTLLLKGNLDKSSLSGDIVLLEGRYYKDVKLDIGDVVKKKRAAQPGKEKKTSPFLEKMDLDINLTRREPFLVENNLATLHVSPDLNLHGSAGSPLMSGRAQVDSGIVRFQKREFEVRKGVVDFTNPYKIEPTVDLEGVVDVKNWTIFLAVSGTPDNLDFNFTSSPPEQHADILSILAFGKPTRELISAQGGSNFTPTDILSGFVAETMQENLKNVSGLDHLELGISGDGEGEGYGGKILVGKDLSKQLTVKYGMDIRAGETVQQVVTDYKILETLLMSGYQDSHGDFGGGLKFRLEFR